MNLLIGIAIGLIFATLLIIALMAMASREERYLENNSFEGER